jgi:hypothetical protein
LKSVLNEYGYLWNIFSFFLCLQGNEAKAAFDRIDKTNCMYIQMDFDNETTKLDSNCKSVDFERRGETFIVDQDFKWTYVVTHETGMSGPYFYKKN